VQVTPYPQPPAAAAPSGLQDPSAVAAVYVPAAALSSFGSVSEAQMQEALPPLPLAAPTAGGTIALAPLGAAETSLAAAAAVAAAAAAAAAAAYMPAAALSSFGGVSEAQSQEALPPLVLPIGAIATAEGSLDAAETSLAGWQQRQQHQQQQQPPPGAQNGLQRQQVLGACPMTEPQSISPRPAAAAAAAAATGNVKLQPGVLGKEQGSVRV
jgi:hypothetical protein